MSWNDPYSTSTIGWVAPCTTEGHQRRKVADVPVTVATGETGHMIRLCRECQDELIKRLRASIPRPPDHAPWKDER